MWRGSRRWLSHDATGGLREHVEAVLLGGSWYLFRV